MKTIILQKAQIGLESVHFLFGTFPFVFHLFSYFLFLFLFVFVDTFSTFLDDIASRANAQRARDVILVTYS